MNILVVNDEEEICKMLIRFLSSEKARVKFVLTGEKAVELVKKEYFDVVFLDIGLPDISGMEVLDKIKEVSPETKVIMMTGKIVTNDLIKKVKKKGASKCIQKPFKIEGIEKILIKLNNWQSPQEDVLSSGSSLP